MEVNLDSNEIIVAEAGAMVYMTPQINVKTRKREERGILQSLKTSLLGSESFFLNEYVARAQCANARANGGLIYV